MKKFAIVLSGCGVYDGAEIHEATMTMLAVDQAGAEYDLFAPDIDQAHVINHLNGGEMNEKRNVLVESARIARGNIYPLSAFIAANYDAIIFPGGFGVAKNLCSYAFDGPGFSVNAEVEKVVKDMHAAGKPIGALCISPVMIAKILPGSKLTIGTDEGTATHIKEVGSEHINVETHSGVVVDEKNKLVTNPCYMLDGKISDIYAGAVAAVQAMLKLM
ncbi:MAG: isoprenoid biosynthesis protein ElbB [Marinilabiliales bacterium]|nr:MAG: isoprenoid biosynthesis protein ElbB [Marinilabiliales bacterium]